MKLPDDSTSIFYVYIIDYNIVLETFIKKFVRMRRIPLAKRKILEFLSVTFLKVP